MKSQLMSEISFFPPQVTVKVEVLPPVTPHLKETATVNHTTNTDSSRLVLTSLLLSVILFHFFFSSLVQLGKVSSMVCGGSFNFISVAY